MANQRRTGRPPIDASGDSEQLTTILPGAVVNAIDEIVEEEGSSRSEVLRNLTIQGLAARQWGIISSQETTGDAASVHEQLAPATTLVGAWIAAAVGRHTENGAPLVRARFVQFHRSVESERRMLNLLLEAATEQAGQDHPPLTDELIKDLRDPELRGQLFFEVLADLRRRDVRMPPPARRGAQ